MMPYALGGAFIAGLLYLALALLAAIVGILLNKILPVEKPE